MDTPERHVEEKTEPSKKKLLKIKERISRLPEKKPHLDFIAAILTIPLLIITLVLNLNNLTGKNSASKITPTLTPAPTIIYQGISENVTPLRVTTKPQPTASQNQCIKDIGPISISYPQEGQTISDNPVCIGINYQAGNYCSVVWAYQINGGNLSDYSNDSVCLYNLPSGQDTFVLHVKSLASPSTMTLTRSFSYKNISDTVTITPTLTATTTPVPTASLTPTH